MNKSAEFFCKQNLDFDLHCQNPQCKKKHTFKSKEVFKTQSFEFKCDVCGSNNIFDANKFIRNFESQMKKIGVHLK